MLSETLTIPETIGMTPMEKRLARRIHNQRRRLRQLEEFKGWHQPNRPSLVKAYRDACKWKAEEIRRLKARGFWSRLFNLDQ